MKKSFYMTIHSHGDSHVAYNNTVQSFNVHLGQILQLEDDKWEVGLAEINYPMTIPNIQGGTEYLETIMLDRNKDKVVRHIIRLSDTACYLDNIGLINALNREFKAKGSDLTISCVDGYACIKNKIPATLKKANPEIVLLNMLGFERFKFNYEATAYATSPMDANRSLPGELYIYTNIIEHQHVNCNQEPLLRVVPVNTRNYRYGCLQHEAFSNIFYHKISRDTFDHLEFYIKDAIGDFVTFLSGSLTLTLHFRTRDG